MKIVKDYINLLPRQATKPAPALNRALPAAVVYALLWLLAFGWQVWQGRQLQQLMVPLAAQRQALQQELAALQKELGLTATHGLGVEKAALISRLLGERVSWSEVFKQFSQLVPKGLWFDSLEGGSTGKAEIRIRGGAFNYVSVAEFMLGMEKSGYFDKPQLLFAQKATVQGRDIVGFELVCGIRKAEAR